VLIGELARKTGCSRDTLRFYERLGLIESRAAPRGRNNYRHYDRDLVDHIALIRSAKTLGFTLAEIGRVIGAWQNGALSVRQKREVIQAKMVAVNDKIREMQQIRRYLRAKLERLG
jgi:MerR family Zn(II)-responsive transcriptional regulator of zntA